MAVSRAALVDAAFIEQVRALPAARRRTDLDSPVRTGSGLTARHALQLFEVQVESRLVDLLARDLKAQGDGFYTIGGSGHEGNAAVAAALNPDDPAFLHYRSGGFFLARCKQLPGAHGPFDMFLGMCGSTDEPIAGGRHKVFGSLPLQIPPQTSTIASHLPKAMGYAVAMDRMARWAGAKESRVVVCTFGDASSNHATANSAFNAAAWGSHQNVPCPVLFVCEDNGLGISVRSPKGWVQNNLSSRYGLHYQYADGLDLPAAYDAAKAAVDHVRRTRRPAILHLRTVRLLGHAGSDVEQLYRTVDEIKETEAQDPVLATAAMLIAEGWLTAADVIELYEDTRRRLSALAQEAARRPRILTAEAVMEPLFQHDEQAIAGAVPVASEQRRKQVFGALPELSDRARPMAFQLNRALHDVLAADDGAIVFGEDVARKGGVYHVTADLIKKFGVGRVFNTLLDETSILGLALGAAQAGLLPIPEIQYLAYLHNAIDQLRGEAGSLQYFSQGQFSNPMVVRIAGLAYQKGFGGHYHNDQGIAGIREIPGVLIGCPAQGADGARMLRTMTAAARACGRVCILLEPIALYHMKDLHEPGDGAWLTTYPSPEEHMPVGEIGVWGEGADLCIASFANGLWMSLRVAERLRAEGIDCRVIDLRWLHPLPLDELAPHAEACGKLLVVDECRRSSGIADTVAADVWERFDGRVKVRRVVAPDTYIPLGAAANLVLVGEEDIERAARTMLEER